MTRVFRSIVLATALWCASVVVSNAQLAKVFDDVFTELLDTRLQLGGAPTHRSHFLDAAAQATGELTPALNSLIAGDIASFPLTSTIAGVTFDFSSGRPVSIQESLGPIFAETGETLGRGNINVGFNYTFLNLASFRGLDTKDIRFTFVHEDIGAPGLGDDINESDTIDMLMGIDVDASIFAFFGTIGVTSSIDVGVAVPVVKVSLSGSTVATVNSFSFARTGFANHSFNSDGTNPVLVSSVPYDESVTGIGDISLRLKYGTNTGGSTFWGALVDVRLPTGEEDDFLGTGETNVKVVGIASTTTGDMTPHLNVGYDVRGGDVDSDEFVFAAGFDQKVHSSVTFAAEILGAFDLESDKAIRLAPGTTTIVDQPPGGSNVRVVDLSNVRDEDKDHRLDVAMGFRIAPNEKVVFLANIIVPLNDGGLRSTVVPTIGLSINF